MNIFEKILYFLQGQMNTPKPYGIYHLTCMLIVIILVILTIKNKDKYSEKNLKRVLAIYGIVAFILELLKQLIWAFNYDKVTGIITWEYSWYSAPFQLCTTPIYVSLICLFLKKGKIRDSLLGYLSLVTILGSVATMLIPTTVFTKDILVNIHTMYLHLGSLVLSLYIIINNEIEFNFKTLFRSLIVFLIFIIIAQILNISIYNSGILNGSTFNMFYISPYFTSELPVFNILQEKLPFIIYLVCYYIIVSIGATLVYLTIIFIKKILKVRKCN